MPFNILKTNFPLHYEQWKICNDNTKVKPKKGKTMPKYKTNKPRICKNYAVRKQRNFYMLKNKSQIHTMETIVILAIFFGLLMLGFVFYSRIFKSSVDIEEEKSSQLIAVKIAQRAISMPELQCTEDNVIKSNNCVDYLKLKSAKNILNENKAYYYDKFGFSTITIKKIYPKTEETKEWQIYNRILESKDYTRKYSEFVPIIILNPIENKNYFGIIHVTVFLK